MQLTLIKPDDWHVHVRDNETLRAVLAYTARQFARAIIMPNLAPPITTTGMAKDYRQRILSVVPDDLQFDPLMTLYLTDDTTPEEIHIASESRIIHGLKLYPAGATTNSASGVTDIRKIYSVLEAMQQTGLPLQVHGEVVDESVDVFDRERVFIDRILIPLHKDFPQLRIIFEHITTRQAVEFINSANDMIAATITPQHLLYNRNEIFNKGIRPHYYCLPVLKREEHRLALVQAATSGNANFFLGTDSAPHGQKSKESACGCAGIFSAHAAIELYAEVFDTANALQQLEAFASINGAVFYGLPVNQQTITLHKEDWRVPDSYPLADDKLIPMRAGETIQWKLQDAL